MNDRIRFASLLMPEKYGYQMAHNATDHWDQCRNTGALLSYHALYFETLGDGQTQHTPLRAVHAQVAHDSLAVDWMLSFASHMLANPADWHYSVGSLLGYSLPGRDVAQFLLKIKEPKEEDGPVYYSLEELKTSRSDSKRHDKRWHTLQSSSFRLFNDLDRIVDLYHVAQPERRGAFTILELIGVVLALADGIDSHVSFAASSNLSKWLTEDLLCAAKTLRQAIKSIEATRHAHDALNCVVGNMRRAMEQPKAA